jgi:hypothetical protein
VTEIFVFGSNMSGVHGAGAAKYAREKHGAKLGIASGRTGDSYAIPTKDYDVATSLSLTRIHGFCRNFIRYANDHPELTFRLTAIGCGLAGFTAEQIAPMLCNAPINVRMPPEWRSVLSDLPEERFWSYDEVR